MPNRMIEEGMLSSDRIASLSDFEFRLWIGLILSADDLGRGDARTAIIKGRVFPLRERLSLRDIEDALHGLAAKGCVCLYSVGGKPYFWFPTWGKHQRIRNVRPKYPGPEDAMPSGGAAQQPQASGGALPQSAAGCNDLPRTAANCRELPPKTKTKTKTNQDELEHEHEPEDEDELRARARGGLMATAEDSSVVGVIRARLGSLSGRAEAELEGFVASMGVDCVLRALDAAQDAGRFNWGYIRGILRRKQDQGVASAEQWDAAEARHQDAKAAGGQRPGRGMAGYDCQPSPERARASAAWLEDFLRQQEEGK